MFFRIKAVGSRRYLQIVENRRVGQATRQSVLATLGAVDALQASGKFDVLLRSGARLCDTTMLVSSQRDSPIDKVAIRRIGGPLVFDRLWQETGCRQVIDELAATQRFGFAIERVIFAAVLHRLLAPSSERACERWLEAYRIEGLERLGVQQMYRAMSWLGERVGDQRDAAQRRTKDLVEEALFARRRPRYPDLSVAVLNASSLFLDVAGIVFDGEGRPICSEIWPASALDAAALLPVIERLRSRFGIARLCVVADRGLIGGATLLELERRGIEYVLGGQERSDREIREFVLRENDPTAVTAVPRRRGNEARLAVKEVGLGYSGRGVGLRRYVMWRTESEAKRDAAAREAILASLGQRLRQGDKDLAGNPSYRRFLAPGRNGQFMIDPDRLAADARFDGLSVLRTNSPLSGGSVAMAYRQSARVGTSFRSAKAILDSRAIYRQSYGAVVGHLFCSFLALLLRKELEERLLAQSADLDWGDVVRDLDRVEEVQAEQGAKRFLLRAAASGCAAAVFSAAGVAPLPPVGRLRRPSQPCRRLRQRPAAAAVRAAPPRRRQCRDPSHGAPDIAPVLPIAVKRQPPPSRQAARVSMVFADRASRGSMLKRRQLRPSAE